MSDRRACGLIGIDRSTCRRRAEARRRPGNPGGAAAAGEGAAALRLSPAARAAAARAAGDQPQLGSPHHRSRRGRRTSRHERGVELRLSRPGTPTDSPLITIFNDTFRDEYPSQQWFDEPADARITIESWRIERRSQPAAPLAGEPAPCEFAAQASAGLRSADA